MIIKVCGMRDGENIRQVTELGAGWIGMVFCDKSPRNVTMIPTHAGIIPDRAPDGAAAPLPSSGEAGGGVCNSPKRVGVFFDEMAQNIVTRVVNFKLDLIQLNGHESPTLIRNLRATLDPDIRPGIKIIKTINAESGDDMATYKQYEDCVDYFLFDTKLWPEAYDGKLPFLLGGDIGPGDAARVLSFHHPKCIGINLDSRFETEPGIKDISKLKQFCKAISS